MDQSLEIDAGNLAMISTDGITATGAGEITVPRAVEDDAGTMDVDETVAAFETDATFDGASGTLMCAATSGNGCTVTLDGDGDITAFGTDWIFTPDADVTVDVADADYLHYGFWLQRTTDEDGATTYNEVQTFAGSSVADTGSVASVTGSATYEGGAAGVYVKNVFTSDGDIDTATSGHFTADAELTAYFGQTVNDTGTPDVNEADQIAPALLNTLTGTIDNFNLSGGEDNAWAVSLQGARSNIDTGDGTASGMAQGGGMGVPWTATFHGPNEDAGNAPIQPHSVTGEFGANFSNGSVAGGFGARKQD